MAFRILQECEVAILSEEQKKEYYKKLERYQKRLGMLNIAEALSKANVSFVRDNIPQRKETDNIHIGSFEMSEPLETSVPSVRNLKIDVLNYEIDNLQDVNLPSLPRVIGEIKEFEEYELPGISIPGLNSGVKVYDVEYSEPDPAIVKLDLSIKRPDVRINEYDEKKVVLDDALTEKKTIISPLGNVHTFESTKLSEIDLHMSINKPEIKVLDTEEIKEASVNVKLPSFDIPASIKEYKEVQQIKPEIMGIKKVNIDIKTFDSENTEGVIPLKQKEKLSQINLHQTKNIEDLEIDYEYEMPEFKIQKIPQVDSIPEFKEFEMSATPQHSIRKVNFEIKDYDNQKIEIPRYQRKVFEPINVNEIVFEEAEIADMPKVEKVVMPNPLEDLKHLFA